PATEWGRGPGGGCGLAGGRRRGERHCPCRGSNVTEELARVGDASIGGEARLERRHPVERAERGRIAAELELGVADDAVDAGGRRRDATREQTEIEGLAEAVT